MADSTFGASSLRSNGPSMSLVGNNSTANGSAIGVGNFKGVMLCNRPFAGTVGKSNAGKSTEVNSFTCGVVPDAPGQTVLISSKDKYKLQRSKKDSVLSKHRKWLADLQKTKDELETQLIEEMEAKEETKKKFIEHEARLRARVRGIGGDISIPETNDSDAKSTSSNSPSTAKQRAAELKSSFKQSQPSNNKTKGKPAWALSLTQAESKDDLTDGMGVGGNGDEDELMKFAEGLDFNKYMGDIEVVCMMDKLKKRIKELEREVVIEDGREGDREERQRKREMLAMLGETASLMEGDEEEKTEDEELTAAAKALLQADEDMHGIHSQKSVAAMMKATRNKVVVGKGSEGIVRKSNAQNEPLIVVHDPSEGTRLEKNVVNNLPYMHRNPAV